MSTSSVQSFAQQVLDLESNYDHVAALSLTRCAVEIHSSSLFNDNDEIALWEIASQALLH